MAFILRTLFLTALALTVSAAGYSAHASEPRLISSSGDWNAYFFMEGKNKVCYMASQPLKSEGKYGKRGEAFALITHRPSEGSKNVFSFVSGYSYKDKSEVVLTIDSQNFTLFTQDENAWAPDSATDEKIMNALRKGASMTITGTSSRGTKTVDRFSLKGSGGAHDIISKECGIK